MMKLTRAFVLFLAFLLTVSAPATVMAQDAELRISAQELKYGIVKVNVKSDFDKRIRIGIHSLKKDDTYYLPYLAGDEEIEIPLMYGNGEYEICLFEELNNNYYELMDIQSVKLKMDDYENIYLTSNIMTPWDESVLTIGKTEELICDKETNMQKFLAIYTYITENIKYDHKKTLKKQFRSSPDKTIADESGTCLDFAVLLAAMLRYSGIKCKLVYGYKNNIAAYHSWNEVLLNGRWVIVDPTIDAQSYEKRLPYEYAKSREDYKAVNKF